MKLPQVDKPTYEVKILSRDKPIKIRPFLVKEQKIFLMAKESKEIKSIVDALKQIANNCIVDPDVDVEQLPMIDLEIIFLALAAKSRGEVVNFYYKCNNVVEEKECGMLIEAEANITDIPVEYDPTTSKISLTDSVGVQMKLPSFEAIRRLTEIDDEIDKDYLTVSLCIDYVWDKDGVYKFADATEDERLNFIEQLTEDKYELLESFVKNVPSIKKDIHKQCPKCNYQHKFVVEGIEDFFI